ncbi:hypothetical protein D3C81_1618380 [compost metagenome]
MCSVAQCTRLEAFDLDFDDAENIRNIVTTGAPIPGHLEHLFTQRTARTSRIDDSPDPAHQVFMGFFIVGCCNQGVQQPEKLQGVWLSTQRKPLFFTKLCLDWIGIGSPEKFRPGFIHH